MRKVFGTIFVSLGFVVAVSAGLMPLAKPAYSADMTARLTELANGSWRSEADKARNDYRHPVETLNFFGINDHMSVVELSPSGGWYMEILAPLLKDRGIYYAAGFSRSDTSDYAKRMIKVMDDKIASHPDLYGKVRITPLRPPATETAADPIAPEGSADMVLTFRNIHNWLASGTFPEILARAHKALKPGGVLGVVEHRADPAAPVDEKAKSGYVNEAYIIGVIEKAGFKLEAASEINANPKDDHNHPKGVWTLPPTYSLGDQDRAKYQAIGESDRMTLKFRKI
ncbi:class I SAM-dependent methyltransferase [Govanella unica]|uniref:Methyltransferase n=1 Tax=Govanella unica TaxID=2975056 RepID=A0A9X3Z7Z2_9PROT|nr:hypothetical protein [Govania unica]MDA5194494.1 methyltransferase [Govania unica]